ncbi:MAG: hypothetical protein ABJA66_09385 [Actinomycetota bacterium]
MKKIFTLILYFLALAVSTVSAQTEFCFKNEGLKQVHTVSFTVTGNKIEGTFEVSGYDESTSAETFEFTGIKSGNLLTIKFSGTVPYQRAPKTSKIVWTLGKTTLKIPIYGKNYNSNKYLVYPATYEKCSEL